MSMHLGQALPKDEFNRLTESMTRMATFAAAAKKIYTASEVADLLTQDVTRAVTFFSKYGIDSRTPQIKMSDDKDLMNAYWDGKQIVFGMGMVNSDIFNSYSSTIVLHEATHSLFSIDFKGQSGAVSESISDVIAALIARQWTIGIVRTLGDRHQTLRSLSAPGTAYDDPVLGKDPQVDHMRKYVNLPNTPLDDNGGTHIYPGILNKAAFLLTEGGVHENISVNRGLGWDKSAKLYMEVVKKLRLLDGKAVNFTMFRDLVVGTAHELLPDKEDQLAVTDAFRAVGL
jgi:Zn-dependent metalloprotease